MAGELKKITLSVNPGDVITVRVGQGGAAGRDKYYYSGDKMPSAEPGSSGGASSVTVNGSTYTAAGGPGYSGGGSGGATSKRGGNGWITINTAGDKHTLQPSATVGTATITANKATFNEKSVGSSIMLRQEVASVTVSTSNGTSGKVCVGENWKVISHGTWTGSFEVQKSLDGITWKQYRKYTAKDDYNPSESGSVTEAMWLRVVCSISSGTCNVDLTSMPYSNDGTCIITRYYSSTQVQATITKDFADTSATEKFLFGAWSEEFGYPQTLCFFQDRLCFGGNKKQPYVVWMSRTGDYGNFSVEKASGTVTDDSAIAASFISRKQFKILHMIAGTDLIVLTAGNEWTVSGSDTVTPSKIVPKMQATRGCGIVEPLMIGGRVVFVQGRGSTVRDMAYSYETDSYNGNDLTLLAKHMVEGKKIVDATYKQEPDSTLYFVRDDGVIACLAYILDQKVYAWSTIETKGAVCAIAAVQEGEEDVIYVAVKRTINGQAVRNIERLNNNNARSSTPNDYVELDAAMRVESEARSTLETKFSVPELAGETVDVLGDGRRFSGLKVDENGVVTLPATVQRAIIGLPYTTVIELPNVEIKTGDGTMQGRKKQISNCVLRLQNSLGGAVGPDKNTLDILPYDETSAVSNIQLFTGDKEMVLPIGGFNNNGRLYIQTDAPYPFNLLAAIREVSFGG